MDIPVGAQVICSDGHCGRSTYVVLNPVTENLTHFVVKEDSLPYIERLVAIDEVQKSDAQHIYLRCSRSEFEKMEPFFETDFIHADMTEYSVPYTYPPTTPLMVWPYMRLPEDFVVLRHEHIPPSELAVRRGALVHAADGHVGEVDEFIVDPKNGHITHLVLREGHLWGKKDVFISVAQIDHIDENDVYLKLSKLEIAGLPAIPIK